MTAGGDLHPAPKKLLLLIFQGDAITLLPHRQYLSPTAVSAHRPPCKGNARSTPAAK